VDGVTEFFQMGGYAAYVWPAFAAVAALMAGLLVASVRGARRSDREVEALRSRRRGGELDP
jgi:heme exporter protein D